MFYSVNFLRTVSQIALRYYFKRGKGDARMHRSFARKKHIYIVEHQKIPTITHTKKIRYLKLMFLVLFMCGRMQTFGLIDVIP